jgi:hypothetical protein
MLWPMKESWTSFVAPPLPRCLTISPSIVRLRHCEPTGRREAPPADRLREAIQKAAKKGWITSSLPSSQ